MLPRLHRGKLEVNESVLKVFWWFMSVCFEDAVDSVGVGRVSVLVVWIATLCAAFPVLDGDPL